MKCHECMEQLSSYIDNRLTPEEEKEVGMHLETCPSCTEELAVLETVLQQLNKLQDVEVPQTLHKDIMERIKIESQAKKNIFYLKPWMKYVVSSAAVLLIVVMVFQNSNLTMKTEKLDRGSGDYTMQSKIADEEMILASDAGMADNQKAGKESALPTENRTFALDKVALQESASTLSAVMEEWEITSGQKDEIAAVIKTYAAEQNVAAEYMPDEEHVTSIVLYQVTDKTALSNLLEERIEDLSIYKKEQTGEDLKIIIK
ncbi:MAG: hypothetical protein K0S30_1027 [Clostridia bacterium]|nr:hypothetical protein [Clostridia bacterium]